MKKIHFPFLDIRLIVMVIALSSYGVVMIGSAKEGYQSKQLVGLIMGVVLMMVIALIDYNFVLKFYWLFYGANLGLLVLVNLIGKSANNSQRWISLFGIRFQPSEITKIILILFFAKFIMVHVDRLNTFRVLAATVALFAPVFYLVYKQPDLSTSIILILIYCTVMYVGGVSRKLVYSLLAIIIPVVGIGLFLILQPDQQLVKDYQQGRILAWLQPDKYALTTAYQQQNSITAIGSGQLTGKGLNNNEVGSVKNGNYISEPQTDFIFAIVGEELGFVGSAAIIILECVIAWLCFVTGVKAKDRAGEIICCGVGGTILFQSLINIGVATGILPNTGLPLPFVSYGLTSLISLYIGIGFVLSVGLHRPVPRSIGSITFTELLQANRK